MVFDCVFYVFTLLSASMLLLFFKLFDLHASQQCLSFHLQVFLSAPLYQSSHTVCCYPTDRHILTRTIAHAVVPALMHTTTHSPMQDYYCYYCYKDNEYCQYCQYAPSQIYWGMYYAGYYSTYYGDYYATFYGKRMGMMMERDIKREKEIIEQQQKLEVMEE